MTVLNFERMSGSLSWIHKEGLACSPNPNRSTIPWIAMITTNRIWKCTAQERLILYADEHRSPLNTHPAVDLILGAIRVLVLFVAFRDILSRNKPCSYHNVDPDMPVCRKINMTHLFDYSFFSGGMDVETLLLDLLSH